MIVNRGVEINDLVVSMMLFEQASRWSSISNIKLDKLILSEEQAIELHRQLSEKLESGVGK